jgi:hypothetical protein
MAGHKTKYAALHYKENSGLSLPTTSISNMHDTSHSYTWRPGMKDHKNLKGTTRTLDGASGEFSYMGLEKIKAPKMAYSRAVAGP